MNFSQILHKVKVTLLLLGFALAVPAHAQQQEPGFSEAQWKKVDEHSMTDIQMLVSLQKVQNSLQTLNSPSHCPQKTKVVCGVPEAFYNEWVKEGVPEKALKKALTYEVQDPHVGDREKAITNKEWMTIIDYTAPSSQERMFVLNLKTGEMIKSLVAHGKGSDDGHGQAVHFSNQDSSLQTSPGFLKIAEPIVSPKHGKAFKLEGLEQRNSEVANRAIILHAAPYVSEEMAKSLGRIGRSWGCPAVSPEMLKVLYSKNIPGSLLYGYTPEDAKDAG